MSDENSLINIGDLAKPATTLIEKVADFTGAAFRPYQIKRVAKAKAEAKKTKALANIEITELQRRAMTRVLAEETRNQENIENITAKALPELNEDAKPEEIEDDWLAHFFNKSKRFSDAEMQYLWAKILAGEANKKGSFSKRTIELVATFDQNDAELFTNLCGFVWQLSIRYPLIYDFRNPIYQQNNINFDSLSHLEDIGLIKFAEIGVFSTDALPKINSFSYFDTVINLEISDADVDLIDRVDVGNVLFTKSGEELALICKAEKVNGFLEYVLENWLVTGHKASSPLTIKN